jgi:hypothetical protein
MPKRRSIFLSAAILVLAALFAWQLPALLKAVPSRYVARLPAPVQTLGVREHVERLPTAAVESEATDLLLADGEGETPTPESLSPPASPTPPPTRGTAGQMSPSPTSTVLPTPVPSETPIPVAPSARLAGFQHHIQTWNNCGPATLSMALSYFDIFHSQEQVAQAIKPDPEDRNVTPEEMAGYVTNQTELKALSRANGDLQTVRRLLSEEIPVIVEYGLEPEGEYRWLEWMGHYLLLSAYDDAQETFWVYDSWPRLGELPDESFVYDELELDYEEMDRHWRQFNRNYIVLYEPADEDLVADIIGEDMNDDLMWENALRTVQRELNAKSENAFLWFNLGTVFNALGDYERAASAFDRSRALGLPWRMLWYQFGPYEAYYQTGRYEDVMLLADTTLQDRPYFEESYYYKALAQIELGDLNGARRNLQRAIDFNPNFTPASKTLQELEVAGN